MFRGRLAKTKCVLVQNTHFWPDLNGAAQTNQRDVSAPQSSWADEGGGFSPSISHVVTFAHSGRLFFFRDSETKEPDSQTQTQKHKKRQKLLLQIQTETEEVPSISEMKYFKRAECYLQF